MFDVTGGVTRVWCLRVVTHVWCYRRCNRCLILQEVLHLFDVTGGATPVWCYRRCYTCLMLQEMLHLFDVTGGVTHVWYYRRCYTCLILQEVLHLFDVTGVVTHVWCLRDVTHVWCYRRCYTCLMFKRCYTCLMLQEVLHMFDVTGGATTSSTPHFGPGGSIQRWWSSQQYYLQDRQCQQTGLYCICLPVFKWGRHRSSGVVLLWSYTFVLQGLVHLTIDPGFPPKWQNY